MRMDDHPEEKPSADNRVSIDIFTVLGHDLKSPLNAVESYLEIILNKVLGDSIDPYRPMVENSIVRLHQMRELIADVVDWSKLQQPPSSRNIMLLDVSKTVRRIVDRYAQDAQNRGIVISADIEDGLTIPALSAEIELIVRHLMDNAIKYNKDNGSVHVFLTREGSQINLKVADTGIGLTAEEQARLFNEFVRIKNSKTQDVRGTGLGLAIVKRVIELYHGNVSVESKADIGTTFSLTFPCEG
jgi:signal transduction histidine kinase